MTNPLRFCEQAYAVVMGLGLALSVTPVVDLERPGIPIVAEHLPLFVAYLAFAFPFAHSAVRYLDIIYVEKRLGPMPVARTVIDVMVDGVRLWWLVILALFVSRPVIFGFIMLFLLATDGIRVITARWISRSPRSEIERIFERVNLGMLAVVAAVLLIGTQIFNGNAESLVVRLGIHVAALIYPVVTYVSSFRYFFDSPPGSTG